MFWRDREDGRNFFTHWFQFYKMLHTKGSFILTTWLTDVGGAQEKRISGIYAVAWKEEELHFHPAKVNFFEKIIIIVWNTYQLV